MNNAQMVKCFNEWMRRYIDDPSAFNAEFETVNKYLADRDNGAEPTYGETCTAFMAKIAAECPAD